MAAGKKFNILSTIPENSLHMVISPLEILCRDVDNAVRETAVRALCNIGLGLNKKLMEESFVPLIQRLVNDTQPTGRAAACTLVNAPYPALSESSKSRMLSAYSKLCHDLDPLVRQEASTNLWRFAATVDPRRFEHDVMTLLQTFLEDGDEVVRSSAIVSCGVLQNVLETSVFMAYILPVFAMGVQDPSLRVRQTVANQLHLLCDDASAGILHAASAGILSQMKEGKGALSLKGVLGLIGVCAAIFGLYFGFTGLKEGVTGLKEGVTGLKELVREMAGEIKTAREVWIAKGCPALITVHPHVFLWK